MVVTTAHWLLIALHAGFAVAAFVLGGVLLAALPSSSRSHPFSWFAACLVSAMVLLIVAVDLRLPPVVIVAVAVLGVVAGVIVIRALVRRDAVDAARAS